MVRWNARTPYDDTLLIASPAPLRYDVEPTPWSNQQKEPKVYPFSFNPSFFVEDAILDYDFEFPVDESTQHDDDDPSSMDFDFGRPKFMRVDPLPGESNTHDNETATFVPPPSPLDPNAVEDAFDTIATDQEDLRDARETLVGFRFRLRSKRREVSTAREEAGSKAGAAISLVKQYLRDQGIELPHDISTAFSEVDTLRDELGAAEVDYEAIEEKYNQEEWRYTRKEEDWMELLEKYMPSGMALPNQTMPENRLLSGADNIPAVSLELSTSSNTEHERHHQTVNMHSDLTSEMTSMAEVRGLTKSVGVSYDQLERLGSKSTLEYPLVQWRNTRRRVNEWLLESVALSSYQRQRLKDEQSWAQAVAHHWCLGSPHTSAFHTGDSTMAESIDTLPAPVVTSQRSQVEESVFDLDTSALLDVSTAFNKEPSVQGPYASVIPLHELASPPEKLLEHDRSPSLTGNPFEAGSVDSLHPQEPLELVHCHNDCNAQQFSAPFIEVAGPESWNLPLVWLGLTASPRYLENTHVCGFSPFVSLPDTPFRLPGPSQFL